MEVSVAILGNGRGGRTAKRAEACVVRVLFSSSAAA